MIKGGENIGGYTSAPQIMRDDKKLMMMKFASVNRNLSRVLLRKARKVKIRGKWQKRISHYKIWKVLQMIENPYHQLKSL